MTDAVRSALEEAREYITATLESGAKIALLAKIDAALAAPPAGGMAERAALILECQSVARQALVDAAYAVGTEKYEVRGSTPFFSAEKIVSAALEGMLAASPQPPVASPVAWDDHLDDIETAIADSIDVDWQPRHAARDVVKLLKAKGPLYTTPPPAPGWNEGIEAAAKAIEAGIIEGDSVNAWMKHNIAAAIRALTPPATGAQPKPWSVNLTTAAVEAAIEEAAIRGHKPNRPATGAQDAERVDERAGRRLWDNPAIAGWRERAAIVAWLRTPLDRRDGPGIPDYTAESLARAIERGDHLKREG